MIIHAEHRFQREPALFPRYIRGAQIIPFPMTNPIECQQRGMDYPAAVMAQPWFEESRK